MQQPRQDRRDSFAAQNGWGWEQLAESVLHVRALRPDAPAMVADAMRPVLQRGAGSVHTWASARGVDRERAYRNLIAGAPEEDLPLFGLVISVPGVLPEELRGAMGPLRDALPRATGAHATLGAMALGEPVDNSVIADALKGSSRREIEWQLRSFLLADPDATAVERIEKAMLLAIDERIRFRLQLIKRAFYFYPPRKPMVVGDLDELTVEQVDELLRWPHLLDLLGQRDGFTSNVLAWRAAPRHALCAEVADAVRRRDLAAPSIVVFAEDSRRYTSIPSDLEPSFAAALATPTDGLERPMHAEGIARLLAALPPHLEGPGRLVLTPLRQRVAALKSLTESRLEEAVRGVDLTELVATLTCVEPTIVDEESDDTELVEDRSAHRGLPVSTLSNFALLVTKGGRGPELLEALLDADSRFTDSPALTVVQSEVFGAWLGAVEVAAPLLERTLLRAGTTVTSTPQAIRNLRASDPNAVPLGYLLSILGTVDRRVALEQAAGADAIELYRDIARRVHSAGWRVEAGSGLEVAFDLPKAAAVMPHALIQVMIETGDILAAPLVAQVPTEAIRAHFADPAQPSAWQQALDLASATRTFLPPPLRELTRSDPRLLKGALESAPGALVAEEVVLFGLASPRIGAVLDGWLTPESRVALLPFIRERYADQPNLATAYEVAVAFSVAYAPYLVALAGRLELPAPPDRRGHQFDDLYHLYELPKHSGGTRTITAPAKGLKGLQRVLLAQGFHRVPLDAAATGFRPGVSIRDNAQTHVGQPVVVNIDIAGFFSNTGYDHILRASRKLCGGQLSERAARFVADICSYQGALPTGAPTSPAIANIALTRVDRALVTAAASRSVRYTRYADDLTFSGGGHAVKLVPFARRLLKELGYVLDDRKTNIYRRGRRQVVTSLVVNEKADLPRRTRRRLRAALHRREVGGAPTWYGKPITDDALMGWFAFMAMMRPKDGHDGLARLRAVRERLAK